MLHVILQILSIIGIVLLCILGLLLLLILLVLFVPIRYRIKGEKNAEVTKAEAKATYLLHLVSVKFTYEKEMQLIARIFGIKVFDLAKKKVAEAEQDAKTAMEADSQQESGAGQEETIRQTEPVQEAKPIQGTETVPKSEPEQDAKAILENETVPETEDGQKQKRNLFSKIKAKILAIIEKIKYTITSIYDKIKNIAETISYYKEVLDKKENRAMYKRVWERVLKILKSIRPRKLKADLLVGTGSPDTTGYVCAIYGMLIPVLGEHVNFVADFEETVFEGNVFAKGRITIFTLLVQGLKLLFDKQIRIFINQLKREDI